LGFRGAGRVGLAVVVAVLAARARAEETPAHAFLRGVVRFADPEVLSVDAGRIVTKPLATADKPEIAAFGAVRVQADRAVALRRFRETGFLRHGPSVLESGRFSSPPGPGDLDGLTLEDADVEAARKCRPGDCALKLASSAMERVRAEVVGPLAEAKPKATALVRRMLVEYVAAYQAGGIGALATYNDKEKPLEAPAEFRKLLAASPYLVEYAPEFHRYVEEYPRGRLDGAEDFFYWTKDKFGPKPTISVYHVTLWQDPRNPGRTVLCSKRIYASHYFQSGLDLVALVDAASGQNGFYLMDLQRVRIDPPTGMLSGVLLGKIRGGIESAVSERLAAAKSLAEAPGRP
jgi:hypothetical protein